MNDQEKDLIRALTRLSVNTDFQRVVQYLNDELDNTDTELRMQADSTELRRLQGRALFLHELLEFVKAAPELAQKYRD